MYINNFATCLAVVNCLSCVSAAPSDSSFVKIHRPDGSIVEADADSIVIPDDALMEARKMIESMNLSEYTDNALSERSTLAKRLQSGYIGFDANDQTDQTRLQQLRDGWSNAIEMAAYVDGSFDNIVETGIYDHYFKDGDQENVREVFENIWGNDITTGSINLGLVFWYNDDIAGECTAPGSEVPGKGVYLAYLVNRMVNGVRIASAHMCEQGYALPSLGDRCDLLGDTVSSRMNVLGAVVLHEYAHFERIGRAAVGVPIIDLAYGPLDTRNLPDASKIFNADNYRWLALEYYWTTFCGRQFSGPREADNEDSACLPGRCVIL